MSLNPKKNQLNNDLNNLNQGKILKILRVIQFRKKLIVRNWLKIKPQGIPCDYKGQEANDFISKKLSENKPCMVARFGETELRTIAAYITMNKTKDRSILWKSTQYILGNIPMFVVDDHIRQNIQNLSGFYPNTYDSIATFVNRMIDDMKNIDILGSRDYLSLEESMMMEYLSNPTIVPIGVFSPFYHVHPWSRVLEGKTVLVIHPFQNTITQQYQTKRQLLFEDAEVLPEFELKTLKAVQSLGGSKYSQFKTWFEGLDWMCEKISKIEFDVAIIGAGAYGFCLASFVKQMGKKSVHLGGATQMLFGIKGKRWETELKHIGDKFYNEHWIRPLESEKPENYKSVEQGCYW